MSEFTDGLDDGQVTTAYAPFEETNESRAVAQAPEATVLIVGGEPCISKANQANYGIFLDLEILQHPDPKAKAKRMRIWLWFTSKSAYLLKNAMNQCGLDYIQQLYDTNHPEYDPERKPVLDLLNNDADRHKLGLFYLNGQLTDNDRTEFDSPHGGLIGREIKVSIGPLGKDDSDEDRTGAIKPLKAGF